MSLWVKEITKRHTKWETLLRGRKRKTNWGLANTDKRKVVLTFIVQTVPEEETSQGEFGN